MPPTATAARTEGRRVTGRPVWPRRVPARRARGSSASSRARRMTTASGSNVPAARPGEVGAGHLLARLGQAGAHGHPPVGAPRGEEGRADRLGRDPARHEHRHPRVGPHHLDHLRERLAPHRRHHEVVPRHADAGGRERDRRRRGVDGDAGLAEALGREAHHPVEPRIAGGEDARRAPRVPFGHRPFDDLAQVAPHLGPLARHVVGQQGELVGVAQQHGRVPQGALGGAAEPLPAQQPHDRDRDRAAGGLGAAAHAPAALVQARANAATGVGSPPGWTWRYVASSDGPANPSPRSPHRDDSVSASPAGSTVEYRNSWPRRLVPAGPRGEAVAAVAVR